MTSLGETSEKLMKFIRFFVNLTPDLEVKNHHSNQAEVVYHLHSTYLPIWLWVLGSHQEGCTRDWCPRSLLFVKAVRNQEQNG